jgi:hypothetical protein
VSREQLILGALDLEETVLDEIVEHREDDKPEDDDDLAKSAGV